jgi:glucose-1-phosphatase
LIKNIIFDLGNVLVNVHFDKFSKELLKAGVKEQVFNELFYSKELKEKFESGSLSKSEFLQIIKQKLGVKISKKKFIEIFSDMFTEIPEMKKFITKIAGENKYKLILLSNTNSFHFNYIKKKFDYIRLLKTFALSYKLKMIKPAPLIYEIVIKRYRLKANETLFTDDLDVNCKAAERAGFITICFKDYKTFKREFDRIKKL